MLPRSYTVELSCVRLSTSRNLFRLTCVARRR